MAVAMGLELHLHKKEAPEKKPKRQLGRWSSLRQAEEQPRGASTTPIKCFRCEQQGHRASECLALAPVPQARNPTPAKLRRPPWKPTEKGKFVCEAIKVSPPEGEEGTPAPEATLTTACDSDDDSETDPMVSKAIHPFVIKLRIVVPRTGTQGDIEAIIDTGCTRCLTSLPTVQKLVIRTKPLACPISFEQVDGSLIVGAPITLGTHLGCGGAKND